jgi:drug/metabolite transporter (DMT)-like permease
MFQIYLTLNALLVLSSTAEAFVGPCNSPASYFSSSSSTARRSVPNTALQMIEKTAMNTTETTEQDIAPSSSASSLFDVKRSSFTPVFQLPKLPAMDVLSSMRNNDDVDSDENGGTQNAEYQRGLVTIGFITLLFASNSPVLHAAFSSTTDLGNGGASAVPPVLLLNAAVSVVALVGLLLGGDSLESNTPLPSALQKTQRTPQEEHALALQGGTELGLWKFLGTTANLYGLALTTAGHGALLIQLTTLIVPVVQGIQGVPIPRRIQASIVFALAGVVCFSQDFTGSPSALGDALCVLAAVFYATYDLRLFAWGKRLPAKRLITSKIGTQAMLSVALLLTFSSQESIDYILQADSKTWSCIVPVAVWSGVAVNALAPFLQVGGQQAIGPTRAQTLYASQPLWAAIMSFVFLGETIGMQGLIGGSVFLAALFLAATADPPDPDCGESNCEV